MGNLKLTSLQEIIMLAIVNRARYGLEIIDCVSDMSFGEIQVGFGTLYPNLKKLEKQGLIKELKDYDCVSNLEHRNCKARRYYQVTAKGKEILEELEKIRFRLRENWGEEPLA